MGKKNKKAKAGGANADGDGGMSRSVRRECLEIVNFLLDKCAAPFGFRGGQEWADFIEVHEQVQKLRRKQQSYVLQHTKREEHLASFLTWLHANEVNTDTVSVEKFETEGFGLKAEKEIETAELFLSIPRKLMMTTESAQQSVLGKVIREDRILQSMPNVILALHVLCERNTPDSFWAPYIKILPGAYTTPLYFTPDEIQVLRGSPVFGEVLSQFRNITRQYAYFFKLFQGYTDASNLPIKNFCYDDYRWAVSTVMTRQNQIPCQNGERTTLALIPLWDMCNHSNGQITTDFNIEKDCSECYALRNFQKGQQVYIYYGSRSNAELLVHNGFVYPENHLDRLAVKLGISKNDPLYSMKADMLARLALLSPRIFHLHAGPEPVDSDMLAYLRIFSMDHASLKARLIGEDAKRLVSELKVFDHLVSLQVELKAWEFLETRAKLLLRAYPTTLEEDEAWLDKPGVSHHKKLAILLKMGEKRILNTTQEYAKVQKALVHEKVQRGDEEIAEMQQSLEDQLQQNGEVLAPEAMKPVTWSSTPPRGPLVPGMESIAPSAESGNPVTELMTSATEPTASATEPVALAMKAATPATEPKDCTTEQSSSGAGDTALKASETKTATACKVDSGIAEDQKTATKKDDRVMGENSVKGGSKDMHVTDTGGQDDEKDDLAEQMQGIEVIS